MMKPLCLISALVLGGIVALAGNATAADYQNTHLKMAGLTSTQNMFKYILKPYFGEEISKKTGGAVTVDYKPSDVLGLKGTEILRLLKMGVFDISTGAISYMAGEDPRFEGMDLPGLAMSIEEARKVADAYKPVIAERMAKFHNTKLLELYPITVQVWYCRTPIGGLADVKGKKVRVYNASMADFVEAAGAGGVNIPFVEVVPAMNRGVADCALTGTSAGNTARWWEVTKYLFNMPMGWAIQFVAINMDTWNRLDAKVQEFLLGEFSMLNEKLWAQAAADVQDGINCNTGKGECKYGIKADPPMTFVPVTSGDKALHKKIVEETVVARWAKRCGSDCAKRWNATIGKVVDMKAPE